MDRNEPRIERYLADSIISAWHSAVPALSLNAGFAKSFLDEPALAERQRQAFKRILSSSQEAYSRWAQVVDAYSGLLQCVPEQTGFRSETSRQEFVRYFSIMWDEGLVLLHSSIQEIETLLHGGFGDLNLTCESYGHLETMKARCYQAIDDWRRLSDYVNLCLNYENVWNWRPVFLANVINQAVCYLREYYGVNNITVMLPNNLFLVRGNEWLERAVVYIVSHSLPSVYDEGFLASQAIAWKKEKDFSPFIGAYPENESAISVQICTGVTANIDEEIETRLNSVLFSPGGRLSIAGFIVERYDSQAVFCWSRYGSKFRFTLEAAG